MERRMLLAVVLSFMAVTLYSVVTQRGCTPQPPPTENGEEHPGEDGANGADANGDPAAGDPGEDEPEDDESGAGNGNGNKPPPAIEPVAGHPQADVPGTEARLESDELEVALTSKGGAVERVTLKHHTDASGELLDLIVPADPLFLFGQIDDTRVMPGQAPGTAERQNLPAGPMRSLHWARDEAREAATPEKDVVYTFETPDGLVYSKRWVLSEGEDRYDLRLLLSVKGEVREAGVDVKVLAAAGQLVEPRHGQDMFGAKQAVYFTSDMGDPPSGGDQELTFGVEARELEFEGLSPIRLKLLGSRSLYFTTLFYSTGEFVPPIKGYWVQGEQASLRTDMAEHLALWYLARGRPMKDAEGELTPLGERVLRSVENMQQAWFVATLPVAPNAPEIEFRFYTGPLERSTLAQDGYEPIDSLMTYPFAPDIVANALLAIYDMWRSLFGSVGLAVLLMTLTVRSLLMPVSIRNQLGMRGYSRKIKKIKPKVDKLQEKYAKNPQKLREEQMKLYREHGIGFPAGCLMMFLQMPIFFSLFSALRREFTLRGAEFLWIKDLSGPDALIDFGQCYQILMLQICGINLLPFLMIVLSIIHTRSMPKPQDEQSAQQYKMMRWFPIVFAVILYNYTAALMLYMTLSSAFGILEAKIVRYRDAKAEAADDANTAWVSTDD